VALGEGVDPKKPIDCASGCQVVYDKDARGLKFELGLENKDAAVAWGIIKDSLDKTGWIELHVDTNTGGGFTNDLKMFAAGFLEGLVTAPRISQFYSNFMQLMWRDEENLM